MSNQLIKIPEYIILDIVKKCLKFIRSDYEYQANKDNSFLFRVLKGNSIERYDLQTQAKQLFIDNDKANQRFVEAHLMFNVKRESLPTIHIMLPSEQTQGGGNGIGTDEGYEDPIIQGEELDNQDQIVTPANIIPVYTRRYQSTYNLVFTSDNINEVILLYHTIRAILTSLTPSIHLAGLQNVSFGGQDLQQIQGLATQGVFMRALSINFQYETSTPNLFTNKLVKDLFATGTPKVK